MERRKSKRSLRLALVAGAALAGTALVGWGGLAAWQAYTQNAGNQIVAGTLAHTNTVGANPSCTSSNTVVNCDTIINVTGIGPNWTGTGSSDQVTITSTGSLNSTFTMSMPNAPGPVGGTGSSLCRDLTLAGSEGGGNNVYGTSTAPISLSTQMASTTLLASNSDGTVTSPWVTTDTNTYTFAVAPTSGFANDSAAQGASCSFDVLFTQQSA